MRQRRQRSGASEDLLEKQGRRNFLKEVETLLSRHERVPRLSTIDQVRQLLLRNLSLVLLRILLVLAKQCLSEPVELRRRKTILHDPPELLCERLHCTLPGASLRVNGDLGPRSAFMARLQNRDPQGCISSGEVQVGAPSLARK